MRRKDHPLGFRGFGPGRRGGRGVVWAVMVANSSSPKVGNTRGAVARRSTPILLLVACIVGTMLFGTGFSASRYALGDGGAWLAGSDGALVHVNGASGDVDWRITEAAGEGDDIEIVQGPQGAYLLNRTTGEITFIDPASLATSDLAGAAGSSVLLVGGGDTYEIDGDTVRYLDQETLEPLADPLRYPDPIDGVVDREARLFLATADGHVVSVRDGVGRSNRRATGSGHDVRVTLVGGRPGLVDRTDGVARPVDPSSGRAGGAVDLGVGGRLQVQEPSDDGDRLWVVSARDSRLVGADLDSGDVVAAALPRARRTGPPQVVGDRVFVPSFDRGSLLRFDAEDGGFLDEVDVGVEPGTRFDSFVKDGFVFVNDARSDVAVVVNQRGNVTVVDLDAPAPGDDGQGYDTLATIPAPMSLATVSDNLDAANQSGPTGTLPVPAPTTTSPPADAPGMPQNPVAVAGPEGSGTATVSWGPPLDDGGSPITGYRVVEFTGGFEDVGPDARSVQFDELTFGYALTFDVIAVSEVGRGTAATTNSITPFDVNGSVTVSATSPAPNQYEVAFDALNPPAGERAATCSITTPLGYHWGGCPRIVVMSVPAGALSGNACATFEPSGRTACAPFSVDVVAPEKSGFYETTGGPTNTWTNWTNAGGTQGPSIASNTTVQIACRLTGWTASNGNNWWYRIAQAPWSGSYYASADAFYNNGATSGSLTNTPFVDEAVPMC